MQGAYARMVNKPLTPRRVGKAALTLPIKVNARLPGKKKPASSGLLDLADEVEPLSSKEVASKADAFPLLIPHVRQATIDPCTRHRRAAFGVEDRADTEVVEHF